VLCVPQPTVTSGHPTANHGSWKIGPELAVRCRDRVDPRPKVPSKLVTVGWGNIGGHIRATSDRTAADNIGHYWGRHLPS
jgi:hypothetical protein